ncbi:uncharacterized protein LOC112271862 [Brachypodium distachyon]|uniref:RNase H type-1 domain-containing protein n=1 Tax=Brachypodium distachyon TaxID=15368 RepID=A0A2K2D3A0_BRADI|nr:uncharacterized protein LOC112271862 [Brachypodium distachyon]XP_024317836.1 uncharacterized protein LOC112271862 [Brachypodium distachyon]PNT68773.1 hypothetical protein BRADI_3g45155v3 [Brachypodium distachyon]PNT68774.1 hypothetical protein BRADI_3g45155v3 [Brachypodium distachyon]|eukprot:XP_024317835.1 uncharacterized protein LOC112271862 [Brachypodium distachyon]
MVRPQFHRLVLKPIGSNCGSWMFYLGYECFGGGCCEVFYPIMQPLARRHVKVQSTWPVCKSASETLLHAMFECAHARPFWVAAKSVLHLRTPRLHPVSWVLDIMYLPEFDGGKRELVISIMAAVWDSRNRWAHDDAGFDALKSIETISETLSVLEKKQNATIVKSPRPVCTWHGPPAGVVKINSDGAIVEEEARAASGLVARNEGGVMVARSRVYQGISDPLIVEALALRDACCLAKEKAFQRVILETDCAELVRLWRARSSQRSVVGPILDEIIEFSQSFISCEIVFVRREANFVAHECARSAVSNGVSSEWVGIAPSFLLQS